MALDFDDNYESTIRFLEHIRRTSGAGGHPMKISMNKCTALAPEVALVLAAEIERCLHHRPKSINGTYPGTHAVAAMLRDIGFHTLLNFNEPKIKAEETSAATTYLKMKAGKQGGGQHADALQELILGKSSNASGKFRDDLIRGLNEAVLNIHEHAYLDGVENAYVPMPSNRWWIAGYRDSVAKEIGFIAFDQGVGIPETVVRKHREVVADLLVAAGQILLGQSPTSDHLLIQRAFEIDRSRTGVSGKGKGLNDFKKFFEAASGTGALRILSGRGSYIYNSDGTEKVEPLPLPFHGTLIVWRLTDSPAVLWGG